MRSHVHFDIYQVMFSVAAVGLGFHALRLGGAWLASHGVGLGKYMGAFATFNGGNG
jgi:hypothetical protein